MSSVSRYKNDATVRGSQLKASARAIVRVRKAMMAGKIPMRDLVLKESERLDKLAGQIYGDGRLWWVIAMTSGIGWGMQAPPGTRLRLPLDIGQFMSLI